jgi:hypothetical protein
MMKCYIAALQPERERKHGALDLCNVSTSFYTLMQRPQYFQHTALYFLTLIQILMNLI